MGSQVKALATTPNNLSYIPRTHMVQKRTDSYKSDLHSLTHKDYKGSKEETTYLFRSAAKPQTHWWFPKSQFYYRSNLRSLVEYVFDF